jgi:predicted nucleotidyltransferase
VAHVVQVHVDERVSRWQLDPSEFSEDSDVDIAVIIDDDQYPTGLVDELSEELAGQLDVIVLNDELPLGRNIPSIRIA